MLQVVSPSFKTIDCTPLLQVLTNSYIMDIPEVAMGFKQRNAGLENLQASSKRGSGLAACIPRG